MAKQYIRDGRNYRYAFKTIQSSAKKDPAQFVSSVMDLVIESRYLAVLKHPNIIKMRAVSLSSPYEEGRRAFVVIDKLYNILSDLLKNQWKERMPGAFKFLKSAKKKAQDFWIERLIAASDIASAISYLHQHGIVYRDIKPHNVGVDVRGDYKVFDFGLAREMLPELENEDGTYRFTGGSGSLRYMAPGMLLMAKERLVCSHYQLFSSSSSILLSQRLRSARATTRQLMFTGSASCFGKFLVLRRHLMSTLRKTTSFETLSMARSGRNPITSGQKRFVIS